jgi:hypothetical protein
MLFGGGVKVMSRPAVATRKVDGVTYYWCDPCGAWVPQSATHIWYGTGYAQRLCKGCDTTYDADPFGEIEWERHPPAEDQSDEP